MSKEAGIYKITNVVNNKFYIGSSSRLRKRKYEHFKKLEYCNHTNIHLQNSFNKYGKENFKWEVLEYIDRIEDKKLFKKILLEREQHYLNLCYGDCCYNICPTAGNNLGLKLSDEAIEKLRIAGKNISNQTRRKRSQTLKGHEVSEETKKKISEALRGRKLSEKAKLKMKATKKRIREESKNKKRVITQKTRDKIGKAHLGKILSEETKKKISLNSANRKSVLNIDTGEIFISIGEAARKYNLNIPSIHHVCKGIRNRKTAGGFRWKYLDK